MLKTFIIELFIFITQNKDNYYYIIILSIEWQ